MGAPRGSGDMRLLGFLLSFVLACGNTTVESVPDSVPAPPPGEGRLFAASTPDGALHVMRVAATGLATPYGPALSRAIPSVDRVGRLLQSADGQRVLVQDNAARKTHALRADTWQDLCADMGAERCYATAPGPDLAMFVLNRSYDDPSGDGAAIVAYDGSVRAPSDGRIAVHSPLGWTVFTDGGLFLLRDDGSIQELATEPGEVARSATGRHLLTFSNDYQFLWFRDPTTGERREARCPDGARARDIIAGARHERCGDGLFAVADGQLEATGNRLSAEFSAASVIHVEPGSYSLVTRTIASARTVEIAILDASGTRLDGEQRMFDEVAEWTSIPTVRVHGWSATSDRVAAYLTFALIGVAHDDVTLTEEQGILIWRRAQPIAWHSLGFDDDNADFAASPVWFPMTRERAYWVTPDGRLLGFDYAIGALADHSAGLSFQPRVYP